MRKPLVLGLNGYGLTVPDIDLGVRFYEDFGLVGERRDGIAALRSPGRDNDEVILIEGAPKRLHHISFFIDPADETSFHADLEARGLEPSRVGPVEGLRPGIWFRDPCGTWIHLAAALPQPTRAEANLPSNDPNASARVDVAAWCELDKDRGPLRLGHILVFTPDLAEAEAFYCDVLGMRVSDRSVGKVTFLAAGTGVVDHHCFGLIKGTHRGFQHSSFQVCGLDDVGFGAWRMRAAGHGDGFGVGRHALASNLFHYVRDPWGSWAEYYADMDKISDHWTAKDWQNLPYVWGPGWSPEFWGNEMNANLEPNE